MTQPGNRWGDATFYDDATMIDARLSETGRSTTKQYLQQQLQDNPQLHNLLQQVELIVVSPLTRCLETFHYGVEPLLPLLEKRNNNNVPILAHPLIRERVYTSSDTGRPVATLKQEFPSVNFDECQPDNHWWYTGDSNHTLSEEKEEEWRPFGQGQYYAVPGEPLEVFGRRLQDFDVWLSQRPERNILIVSHWGVLRHLGQQEWENAQAKVLEWTYCTDSQTRSVAVEDHHHHGQSEDNDE
jgi:broad specificity phosphatase PhoE